MKIVHLQIDESIVDKVMLFLTNLPKKNIRLEIEESPSITSTKKLKALSLKTKKFKFSRDEAHAR